MGKRMACARDVEILYLAHQLWEEDDAPKRSVHSYWSGAAREILASGRCFDRNPTGGRQGRTDRAAPEAFKSTLALIAASKTRGIGAERCESEAETRLGLRTGAGQPTIHGRKPGFKRFGAHRNVLKTRRDMGLGLLESV